MEFFRGAKDLLIDIRRSPEKLAALTSTYASLSSYVASLFKEFSGTPVSLLMLSYTINEFISKKDLDNLFWSILKVQLKDMIHSGLVPLLFYEGNIENFLEYHKELPKAGCIVWAGLMDVAKVKDAIGDKQCVYGVCLMTFWLMALQTRLKKK